MVAAAGLGGVKGASGPPTAHVRHLEGLNLAFADGHVKWYKGNVNATAGGDRGSSTIQNPRTGFDSSGGAPTFNATFQANQP